MNEDSIKEAIKEIPDFPKQGISFKDINSLLRRPELFLYATNLLMNKLEYYITENVKLLAIESRGFIFASLMSGILSAPLILARKKGKLPGEVVSISYGLEYGESVLEIQKDAIEPGDNVIIIDDLLATGGTIKAAIDLTTQLGGTVAGIGVIIELLELNGRELLNGYNIESVVTYG